MEFAIKRKNNFREKNDLIFKFEKKWMTVSKMANFKRKKILNNSIFKIKLSITIKNQSKKIKDNKPQSPTNTQQTLIHVPLMSIPHPQSIQTSK